MSDRSPSESEPQMATCFTELVWMRHDSDRYTRACWNWQPYAFGPEVLASIRFELTLYVDGRDLWSDVRLPSSGLFTYIDSRDIASQAALDRFDGVLTIRVRAAAAAWKDILSPIMNRLYTLVDWVGGTAGIQCLHSDQVADLDTETSDLTEVVILETEETAHELVYLTGDEAIPADLLALTLKNEQSDSRHCVLDRDMPPRSVTRVKLADYLPDLAAFADGGALTVEGRQTIPGRFIRPYVHGVGSRPTIYHGGDRYTLQPQRSLMYKFLGQGKGNPAFVWQSEETRTVVNLLNSHGDLESDFWVDAWLYDESGALICHRERWLLARRHQVSRGDIADLLPAELQAEFCGHIRLHFSRHEDGGDYPGILQALMEYGMPHGVSRVMLWSDNWNAEGSRKSRQGSLFGSWYRVWANRVLQTSFAAAHCSTWSGYDDSTELHLRVHSLSGEVREASWTLAPHATMVVTPGDIWPDLEAFLGHDGYGWAEIIADRDLAKVQYTRNLSTGHMGFEHCMPMYFMHREQYALPPGS